jgi:hypothetical protein
MCIIDEKQEAIAQIRMVIDNDRRECQIEDTTESDVALDLESESSNTWQMGSPEGKKMNLRIMGANLAKLNSQYLSLNEKVRDFIACNMPEEAVRLHFEDDMHVSLNLGYIIYQFWVMAHDLI